jgi:hypothetical protein
MEILCLACFLLLLSKQATWILSERLTNLFLDIAVPRSNVAIDSSLLFLRQLDWQILTKSKGRNKPKDLNFHVAFFSRVMLVFWVHIACGEFFC